MSNLYQELSSLQMPEIYTAVELAFHNNTDENTIINSLQSMGITEYKVVKPKLSDKIIFKIAIVHYKKSWELNDVLIESFSRIETNLEELVSIVNENNGSVYIDIAFVGYDTYPALYFSNKVLDIIHTLHAEISIDPYMLGNTVEKNS